MAEVKPRFWSNFRVLLIITIIIVAIAAFFAVVYTALRFSGRAIVEAVIVGDTGPIVSRDDWPQPLKNLIRESDDFEIEESTIQVYCLCKGMDREYVWRMDASPGLFEHVSQSWNLSQVDAPKWPILDGNSMISGKPTPSWWSPQRDDKTLFFVCPQTLGGLKGDRFQVALDKKRHLIFVHYWDNF